MAIADAYVDLHVNGDHLSGEIRRTIRRNTPKVQQDMDKLGDRMGKRFGTSFGKSFGSSMSLRTKAIVGLAGSAAVASPHILALAGSLAEVAKVGALLPAVIGATSASVATLAVGFKGFGEALKNMDDPKAFAEALKNLAPNAQDAAKAIKAVGPAWSKLRKAVQQNLFAGFAAEVKALSTTYLPLLTKGMTELATGLNKGFKELGAGLRSVQTTSSIAAIFKNTAAAAQPFFKGLSGVLTAFTQIAGVGSSFLPGLAKSFADIGARFQNFIDAAAKSGALAEFIQEGITATKQLLSILISAGRVLNGLIKAAQAAGGGGLANLAAVLDGIADVINGPAFQAGLTDFFSGLVAGVQGVTSAFPALGSVLAGIAPILGDLARVLGPAIGDGLKLISSLITPLLGPLQTLSSSLSTMSGPLLLVAGAFLKFGGLVGLGGPLKIIIAALIGLTALDGAAFAETINGIVDSITGLVTGLASKLPGLIQTVLPALIGNLVSNIPALVSAVTTLLGTVVSQVVPALLQAIVAAIPALIRGVMLLVQGLVNAISTGLPQVVEAFVELIPQLVSALVALTPQLVQTLVGLIETLASSLPKFIPMILGGAVQLFLGLVKGLTVVLQLIVPQLLAALPGILQALLSMLPTLLTTAVQVFTSLIQGLVQVIPTLLTTLLGMLPMILQTLIAMVPTLLTTAMNLFQSLIQGLILIVPALIKGIVDLLPQIIESLVSMIPELITTAITLFTSLITGLVDMIPDLLDTLIGLIDVIVPALITLIPALIKGAVQLFTGLVKAVPLIIPPLIVAILKIIPAVVGALIRSIPKLLEAGGKLLKGVIDGIKAALSTVDSELSRIADDLVNGFVNGLQAAWHKVTELVNKLIDKIPKVIRDKLGIGSPSKVMMEIGRWIGIGLRDGLTGTTKQVQSAVLKLANKVTQAFQDKFDTKKNKNAGLVAAQRFLSGISDLNTSLVNVAKRRATVATQLKDATKKLTDAVKLRNDLIAKVKEQALAFGSITTVQDTSKATSDTLIKNMEDRLTVIRKFSASIAALKKFGLNQTSFLEIIEAGPEQGGQIAAALVAGGKAAVAQVNTLAAAIGKESSALGTTAGKSMYQAGVDAAAGLVRGLRSQSQQLAKAARDLANQLVRAVKRALGIKSPSVIMAKQGDFAVAGFVNSIKAGQRAAAAAGALLGSAVVPSVSSIGRASASSAVASIPRSSITAGGAVTVNMTVSVDDLAKMTQVGDFMSMLQNARMNQRRQIGTVNG